MSIGLKRCIPASKSNYQSKWTGREVDELLTRVAESYDSAHVVIPSTEAVPFNIDTLFEVGNFSIEYITPSVLPIELVECPVKPFEVVNIIDDGVLHQAIHTLTTTYIRTYTPGDIITNECHCQNESKNGTWARWQKHVIDVPENVVCYMRTPGVFPIKKPLQDIDAECVILQCQNGTEINLQAWFDANNTENCASAESTDSRRINADDVEIIHRGEVYKLSDIIDKILSL